MHGAEYTARQTRALPGEVLPCQRQIALRRLQRVIGPGLDLVLEVQRDGAAESGLA